MQFTFWADAVMLVVSVESEESVSVARAYVSKMAELGRDLADLPLLLVGTNGTCTKRGPHTAPHGTAQHTRLHAHPIPRAPALARSLTHSLTHSTARMRCSPLFSSALESTSTRAFSPNTARRMEKMSE